MEAGYDTKFRPQGESFDQFSSKTQLVARLGVIQEPIISQTSWYVPTDPIFSLLTFPEICAALALILGGACCNLSLLQSLRGIFESLEMEGEDIAILTHMFAVRQAQLCGFKDGLLRSYFAKLYAAS